MLYDYWSSYRWIPSYFLTIYSQWSSLSTCYLLCRYSLSNSSICLPFYLTYLLIRLQWPYPMYFISFKIRHVLELYRYVWCRCIPFIFSLDSWLTCPSTHLYPIDYWCLCWCFPICLFPSLSFSTIPPRSFVWLSIIYDQSLISRLSLIYYRCYLQCLSFES